MRLTTLAATIAIALGGTPAFAQVPADCPCVFQGQIYPNAVCRQIIASGMTNNWAPSMAYGGYSYTPYPQTTYGGYGYGYTSPYYQPYPYAYGGMGWQQHRHWWHSR